jgi:bifunctional N-acetylglucosamine-1-phosphate-uridyltransferase/glucosamine-1-phosphate-acetyltransferase GlmU-like protein
LFGLKKYRLLPGEVITLHGRAHVVHRIMALRDIPAQDVKSGDMGGYVSSKKTLSHRGDAWITPNAAVISNPEIEYDYVVIGDVLIADQAVLVDTRVRFSSRLIIGGNAYIQQSRILSEASEPQQSSIIGDIEIVGSTIIGQIKIRDKAYIHDSNISGSEGLPVITAGASILGSSIEGPCRIAGHTHIEFSKVGPNANISDTASVIDSRVGGLGQIHIKDNAAVNKANIDTDSGSKVSISDHVIFEGDESHKAKIEANV